MLVTEPHLAIDGAVLAALKGSDAITAAVGQRIYETVPQSPTFPLITLGDGQSLSTPADQYDGAENHVQVHIWSRDSGFGEVKRLAGLIRELLNGAELELPTDPIGAVSQRLAGLVHEETRHMRDPDGVTKHSVLMFTAFTEPA